MERPPSGPMIRVEAHDYSVLAAVARIRGLLDDGWLISEQRSIVLGASSRSTPDLVVMKGPVTNYISHAPAASDVTLIIEVADASYVRDRGEKWHRYAIARIPTYWIVNLMERQVEVYQQPDGFRIDAAYGSVEVYEEHAGVPVVIAGVEVGRVAVRDILP